MSFLLSGREILLMDDDDGLLLVDRLLLNDFIKSEVTIMPPTKSSSLFTRFKMYSFVIFFLIN